MSADRHRLHGVRWLQWWVTSPCQHFLSLTAFTRFNHVHVKMSKQHNQENGQNPPWTKSPPGHNPPAFCPGGVLSGRILSRGDYVLDSIIMGTALVDQPVGVSLLTLSVPLCLSVAIRRREQNSIFSEVRGTSVLGRKVSKLLFTNMVLIPLRLIFSHFEPGVKLPDPTKNTAPVVSDQNSLFSCLTQTTCELLVCSRPIG